MQDQKITPHLIRSFILQNPDQDEETALLFLQASKGSIERALILYSKYEKQDTAYALRQTSLKEIQPELLTGKIIPFANVVDKFDCPYVYVDLSKHSPKAFSIEQTAKLVHFVLWRMLREGKNMQKKGISFFVDLKNAELKNLDNSAFTKLFSLFSKHFPCRITRIYLYKISWTLNAAEKVTALLSPKLAKRVEKIDKWTDAMSIEAVPAFAGGKAAFGMQEYLQKCTPDQPENSPYLQPKEKSEATSKDKTNSFEQVFSNMFLKQPVAKRPQLTATEDQDPDEECISFDQAELRQKLLQLEAEIETHRTQFNNQGITQQLAIQTASNALPLPMYDEWIEGEWMQALHEHQNLWGRRFSDTRFYEGKAYKVLQTLNKET